jgi:hypothetical protein
MQPIKNLRDHNIRNSCYYLLMNFYYAINVPIIIYHDLDL